MDDSNTSHVNYLRLLRRVAQNRWRLALLIFLGVSIPVAVGALTLLPKTYEAKATIFIEDPTRGGPSLIREWIPPSNAGLQVAILRSRSLAEAVAESLSVTASRELLNRAMRQDYFLEVQNAVRRLLGDEPVVYSSKERLLAELQKSRVTFNALRSGEVEIAAVAYQPRVSMELANAYVEVLQSRNRSYAQEEARTTREFIESLLNQTRTTLQDSEDALAKFQRGKGPLFPQRPGLELTKLAQTESVLADTQASKEIAKVRLSFLRGGKDASGKPLSSAIKVTLQELRDRLAQLEERLAGLLDKYTEQHPLVVKTQAEIKDVQQRLQETHQAVQDPRPGTQVRLGPAERAALAKQMAGLEVEISTLEAREKVLTDRIASFSRNLPTLSAQEMEGLRLLRKVESQRNLFLSLSERLGTARIQEQAAGRGLRVIDLAAIPVVPTRTPIKKLIIMGVFLALGLGGGVATLIEYFNQPLETEDDVTQATGLPVLGWLPSVETALTGRDRDKEPLSFVESPMTHSLPVEGCRTIRTSLVSLGQRRSLRTIMLASPGPQEGKSTVLLNLGWVFWELGRRLVVVDSDLRRPSLHRALRSPCQSGIADLLTSNVPWEKVQRPIKQDFLLLPAGPTKVANPGAVLTADKIQKLFDLLKERADLVLFDSPPVLAVSDNLILASMVDGVILVVRAGHTQRGDLIRAKEQFESVGAPLLGVVLNRVSPRETRRYYARYADYYGPTETKKLWRRGSWWRGHHRKRNGKKGEPR